MKRISDPKGSFKLLNRNMKWWLLISIVLIAIIIASSTMFILLRRDSATDARTDETNKFDGERAMRDVEYQISLGPRIIGSLAHAQTVDWLIESFGDYGWQTEIQETTFQGKPIRNIIAKWGQGENWIILGAHYDSRFYADADPNFENRQLPVPGANDGASGVALLLELARVIPSQLAQSSDLQLWIVLFDAEDNGRIPNWDWILGSRAFVEMLDGHPDAVIVVDMIGDADLNILKEQNSDKELTDQIWAIASQLGYEEYFIPEMGYGILDDHIPFQEAGIPAIDIIDFDYEYWHTVEDTPDKVSAKSLQIVGEVLLTWLRSIAY